jgi:hypothetical protein
MKKYIIRKDQTDLIEIEYNPDSIVPVSMKIISELKPDQRKWLFIQLANEDIKTVAQWMGSKGKVEIVEVPTDLSFEVFWEAYAYKVGKKERVKKKWEAMPEGERTKALAHIKKYNHFLSERPHMERKYAETYLNCAEWNN